MPDIDSARRLIAIGDRAGALRELARLLQVNPRLLEAWLLLAEVVDDPAQKVDCYRQALLLDPGNPLAQQGMERLRLQQTPIPVVEPEPTPEAVPHPEPIIQPEEPIASGEPEAGVGAAPETFSDEFSRLAPEDFSRSSSAKRRRPNFIQRLTGSTLFRILVSLIILGGMGYGIFQGAVMLNKAIPPTPTVTPTLTPVILPTNTPRDTWTPLPTTTSYPTLTPLVITTPTAYALSNGQEIAYVQDGKLWLWKAGASTQLHIIQNTQGAVKISSDGQVVAFIEDGSLWVVNSDGSNAHALVEHNDLVSTRLPSGFDQLDILTFDWIPGTHLILYNTILNSTAESNPTNANDLLRVNADTGSVITLLAFDQGGNFSISPDGKLLALVRPTTIRILNIDGTHPRQPLTFEEVWTYTSSIYYPIPVWAADSSALMVAIPPRDVRTNPSDPTQVWSIPLDSNAPKLLAEIKTGGGPLLISPDLTKVLYQLQLSQSDPVGELHLADIDGSHDTILQNGATGTLLGWAPDSQHYVFQANGQTVLILADTTGAANANLTSDTASSSTGPVWLDDTHYLLLTTTGDSSQLGLGTIDGALQTIAKIQSGTLWFDHNP
jgi:Tol biopolymer transport system component